jgi:structural maintenance of chromosome 4
LSPLFLIILDLLSNSPFFLFLFLFLVDDGNQKVLDQKEQSIKKVEKKYNKCNESLKQASSLEIDLTNQIDNLKRTQKELQDAIHQTDRNITELTEQKKRYVLNESEDLKLPSPSADDLARVDVEYLKSEIGRLQDALQQMAPNLGAIMEYREKQQEFQQRTDELQVITQELEQQLQSCEELRKKRLDEFVAGFTIINMKLREMYRTITLGGDAELEFNDKSDPFAEGISFSVRPPKKSWKNIANLSGGE